MLARLSVALLLSLAACAAHEGPNPTPTPTPTPTPEPRAEVQVAIASVQLAQDCPDPATDAAATPAKVDQAYAPPPPATAAQEIAPARSASRMAPGAALPGSGGGWSPPCVQSTMQLSLANIGDRGGKLEIKAVRLLDAQSKRVLGPMTSRKPSEWNPEGTYRPWNEEVAPRSNIKAAYRLAAPDWGRVQSDLGATVDLYSRPFVIEIEVAVDGRTQTLRSAEVLREQIHMIAT